MEGAMDDTLDFFFTAIFWMLAAPFYAAFYILKFGWQFILKPIFATLENKSADKARHKAAADRAPAAKRRDEVRAEQLAALAAAVPPGVPERMRATIHLNEFRTPCTEQQRSPHLFGEDSFTSVEVGEYIAYAVDMILEMSETERGIIQQHRLDDIILEDTPLYTDVELRKKKYEYQDEVDATKDLMLKEVKRHSTAMTVELLKDHRMQTRVGDLLVSPFVRTFPNPHEAKQYADKLKTKILPGVRELIDSYREHKQSETLEF
jgi:hypothetical protein